MQYISMDDEARIQEYINKGLTREEACGMLGIKYTPAVIMDQNTDLRQMAYDTLQNLIISMQRAPSDYRAGDIIAACKEALDRTEGKAVTRAVVAEIPQDNTGHIDVTSRILRHFSIKELENIIDLDAIDITGEAH